MSGEELGMQKKSKSQLRHNMLMQYCPLHKHKD